MYMDTGFSLPHPHTLPFHTRTLLPPTLGLLSSAWGVWTTHTDDPHAHRAAELLVLAPLSLALALDILLSAPSLSIPVFFHPSWPPFLAHIAAQIGLVAFVLGAAAAWAAHTHTSFPLDHPDTLVVSGSLSLALHTALWILMRVMRPSDPQGVPDELSRLLPGSSRGGGHSVQSSSTRQILHATVDGEVVTELENAERVSVEQGLVLGLLSGADPAFGFVTAVAKGVAKPGVEPFAVHTLNVVMALDPHHGELTRALFHAIVHDEVTGGEPQNLFRGNTAHVKLMAVFASRVAREASYLHRLLDGPLEELVAHDTSLDVNPARFPDMSDETRERNLDNLKRFVSSILDAVYATPLPPALATLVDTVTTAVSQAFPDHVPHVTHNAVANIVFLRLIVPAIVTPEVYNVLPAAPDTFTRRKLVIVGQVLQCVANRIQYGRKQEHMIPLNAFLADKSSQLVDFYDRLIAPSTTSSSAGTGSGVGVGVGLGVGGESSSFIPMYSVDTLLDLYREVLDSSASASASASASGAGASSSVGGGAVGGAGAHPFLITLTSHLTR